MPRVTHVKKARKDVPGSDIKKGESYYWWKFRFGGKRVSRTAPRRSQLTNSAHLGQLYDMEDAIGNYQLPVEPDDIEILVSDVQMFIDDMKSQVEELRDQAQESLDNMPEQLQGAPTGELLQSRIDGADGAESALDEAYSNVEDVDPEDFLGDLDDEEPDVIDWDAVREEITQHINDIDISELEGY